MNSYIWAVISIIELVLYLVISRHRSRVRQMLIFVVMLISNMGFTAVQLSTALPEIVLATKIASIGVVFLLPLVFINIEDICGVYFRKLEILAFTIASVWYCCMLSVGYSDIYYKNIALGVGEQGSYLYTELGVLGYAQYFFVAILLLLIVWALYRVRKAHVQLSLHSLRRMLWIALLVGLCYLVGNLGLFGNYDYHAILNIVCATSFLFLCTKVQSHDLTTNILEAITKLDNFGYIVLDADFNYMAHSDLAEQLYPKLTECIVDESAVDMPLVKEIIEWYQENGTKPLVTQQDRYWLECRMFEIEYVTDTVYIVEFTDETDRYSLLEMTQNYTDQLKEEVNTQTANVEKVQQGIVMGMATVVESRDNSTGGHIKRTALGVSTFIDYLRGHVGYPDKYWSDIIKAAPLHDIGKIAVDDDILRKPGRFTEDEYNQMKSHAQNGADLLKLILQDVKDQAFVGITVNIANYHHEKYDGTGYPKGLKGEEIPFEARIMALADVFDALVSRRCYKEAYDYDRAFSIIESERGKQFDPELCDMFLACREALIELYNGFTDK